MRIGDRIAIMEGGRVVQVGTPEEILQNPADDYVRAFFRGVDPTNILSAGDIAIDSQVTIVITDGKNPRAGLQRLIKNDRDYAYVVDMNRIFKGIVSTDSLREMLDRDDQPHVIPNAYLQGVKSANTNDSLQDILPEVANHPWPLPIDRKGVVEGKSVQSRGELGGGRSVKKKNNDRIDRDRDH